MTLLYDVSKLYATEATSYPVGTSGQSQNSQGSEYTNSIWTKENGKEIVSTATKSIVKKALQLILGLVANESADATSDAAKLNGKAVNDAKEAAEQTKEIERLVNETTKFVDQNNEILQKALDKINAEVQPELEKQKQQIETIIQQINAEKAQLKGKTPQEQLEILSRIDGLAGQIADIIENCTALKALIQEQLDIATDAHNAMVESAKEADAGVNEVVAEVTETTADTVTGTGEATAQGVEGGVNEVNAGVLGTASAALAGTSVVTFGATAAKAADCGVKAADQGASGGIRFATAAAAGAQFLSVLGSLSGNSSAIGQFSSFVGDAYGTFANAVGGFNEHLTPMITTIGSIVDNSGISADVARLQVATAADRTVIQANAKTQNPNENDDKLQTPKFEFAFSFGV